MADFHEVRFPDSISKGSSGGPRRRTDIVTLRSGYEERNAVWGDSRREYDAGLGLRSIDAVYETLEFWEARLGNLYGFRWKDWLDYTSTTPSKAPAFDDVALGSYTFGGQVQLVKSYGSYTRKITKPVYDSVVVGLNGSDVTDNALVDYTTGMLMLLMPIPEGAVLTAGFLFDVPVRFNQDVYSVSLEQFNAGQVPQLDIIEVKVTTGKSEMLDSLAPEVLEIAGVMPLNQMLYFSERVDLAANTEWSASE